LSNRVRASPSTDEHDRPPADGNSPAASVALAAFF